MDRKIAQSFIEQNFTNILLDYPWEDSPECFVYRHASNRKWFALFMTVKHEVLHLGRAGQVDILNLKSDPDLIEQLIHQPGFLPAYHMNKKNWITILLDNTAPTPQIQNLINLSFDLTN